MLQEEREYLRQLQKGKSVDRGRYADHLQKVLEDVLVLRDVTRFLSRLIRQQAELSVCWSRVCDRCGAVSIGL